MREKGRGIIWGKKKKGNYWGKKEGEFLDGKKREREFFELQTHHVKNFPALFCFAAMQSQVLQKAPSTGTALTPLEFLPGKGGSSAKVKRRLSQPLVTKGAHSSCYFLFHTLQRAIETELFMPGKMLLNYLCTTVCLYFKLSLPPTGRR